MQQGLIWNNIACHIAMTKIEQRSHLFTIQIKFIIEYTILIPINLYLCTQQTLEANWSQAQQEDHFIWKARAHFTNNFSHLIEKFSDKFSLLRINSLRSHLYKFEYIP